MDSDRKSTRLNSSHTLISYAVFCLKKKEQINEVLAIDAWDATLDWRSATQRCLCDQRRAPDARPVHSQLCWYGHSAFFFLKEAGPREFHSFPPPAALPF